MSKASTEELNELHGVLAKTLKREIEAQSEDPEGKGLAALLNVARQFLKDNGVEGPEAVKPVGNLVASLPFQTPDVPEGEELH